MGSILFRALGALVLLICSTVLNARMVVRAVHWSLDGASCCGARVYGDAISTRRPGLLMIPNGYGVTPQAVAKARRTPA